MNRAADATTPLTPVQGQRRGAHQGSVPVGDRSRFEGARSGVGVVVVELGQQRLDLLIPPAARFAVRAVSRPLGGGVRGGRLTALGWVGPAQDILATSHFGQRHRAASDAPNDAPRPQVPEESTPPDDLDRGVRSSRSCDRDQASAAILPMPTARKHGGCPVAANRSIRGDEFSDESEHHAPIPHTSRPAKPRFAALGRD